MKRFLFLIIALLCYSAPLLADGGDTSPNNNRLFHIERSLNKNIVCYDVVIDGQGIVNDKNPISVYWINREDQPGKVSPLNIIQRRMAYGYTVKGTTGNAVNVSMVALPDRELSIVKSGDKYIGQLLISQQPAALSKIFVKTRDNNSMKVEYIDIFGSCLTTGQLLTERITP